MRSLSRERCPRRTVEKESLAELLRLEGARGRARATTILGKGFEETHWASGAAAGGPGEPAMGFGDFVDTPWITLARWWTRRLRDRRVGVDAEC